MRVTEEEAISASRVIVAAVALDERDRLVGVRRWESNEPIPAGESLSFEVRVYTAAEPIARVMLLAEAIP